jgi:hypothetical protein
MRHGQGAGWEQATMHSEPLMSDSGCWHQLISRKPLRRVMSGSCDCSLAEAASVNNLVAAAKLQ